MRQRRSCCEDCVFVSVWRDEQQACNVSRNTFLVLSKVHITKHQIILGKFSRCGKRCHFPVVLVRRQKLVELCGSVFGSALLEQATTSTMAQVNIVLESSDATGRVVEDLVSAASSASSSASVGAGPSIWTYRTLRLEKLVHVTKVLSPAFDADTIFYEVNVTSQRTW